MKHEMNGQRKGRRRRRIRRRSETQWHQAKASDITAVRDRIPKASFTLHYTLSATRLSLPFNPWFH